MRHRRRRARSGVSSAARWRCSFASTTTCPSRTWTPRSAPSATPCVSAPPRSRCARARARADADRLERLHDAFATRRTAALRASAASSSPEILSPLEEHAATLALLLSLAHTGGDGAGRNESGRESYASRRDETKTDDADARARARRRGCGWTPSGSTPRRVSDRDPPANPPRQVSCAVRSHRVCFARLATTTDGRRVMGRRHAHTLGSSRWLAWTRRRAARFVSKTLRLLKKTTKTKNDTAKTSSRRNGSAGSCRREGARAKNWMAFISKTSMTSMTLPVRCSVRCAARASRRRSTRATRWRRASRSGPSPRGRDAARSPPRAPGRRTTTTSSPNAALARRGTRTRRRRRRRLERRRPPLGRRTRGWRRRRRRRGRTGGWRFSGGTRKTPIALLTRPRATRSSPAARRRSGTRTGPSSGPRRGSSAPPNPRAPRRTSSCKPRAAR